VEEFAIAIAEDIGMRWPWKCNRLLCNAVITGFSPPERTHSSLLFMILKKKRKRNDIFACLK
jgi:hypothetical protein